MASADTPVTVSSDQARQWAIHELAKPQYHRAAPTQAPMPQPSTVVQPPPPSAHVPSPNHGLTVVLVILAIFLLVIAVLLVLRRLGKPRTAQKKPKRNERSATAGAGADEALTGAALHRRNAQQAASAGDWAEAIRERFRAVIATLDERGLLPERADRTADEAARDAGAILPAHAGALAAAARAFDEVEYGEYLGTAANYAVITDVDELVLTEQPGTLQMPTAVTPTSTAPTVPGGMR